MGDLWQLPIPVSFLFFFFLSFSFLGLQQQGIFRVPGSQVEVNDIKNSFERGRSECPSQACGQGKPGRALVRVLEPATCRADLHWHLFPTLHSVTSLWLLEIIYCRSIYTTVIGKHQHHFSFFFPIKELAIKHLPAHMCDFCPGGLYSEWLLGKRAL